MAKKPSQHAHPTLDFGHAPHADLGYYSDDKPNPTLRTFVMAHATPFDSATDDYSVPAFTAQLMSTKASSTYGMHMYWTKKPHGAIEQYIQHYTQPGQLVLDPMCGSGGTALVALMLDRTAIAIDRSPAATFITKNSCTPVTPHKVRQSFDAAISRIRKELDWLYGTRCERCNGPATVMYTVYSQVFKCPKCTQSVPYFDCVETEQADGSGKAKTISACPVCFDKGHVEAISTSGEKVGVIPVLTNYVCNGRCKPKRAERRHNDDEANKRRFFHEHDLARIKEVEGAKNPHWHPKTRMMHAPADQVKWGTLYRQGVASWVTIDQIFTQRNLWALGAIRSVIDIQSPLGFVLSSIVLNASRMYRHREGGGGGPAGNISLPQIGREMNVLALFEAKLTDLLDAAQETSGINLSKLCVSTQSASDLSAIPANTIDYIFTDPPYSHKFPYGELNFIWEEWLGLDSHWHNEEIIINDVQGKTESDWEEGMRKVFSECYRVLKPGRWISLCYHDTSEGTWSLVQDLMAEAGFVVETTESAVYIDTTQKTIKQLLADKANRRDLVINFRKPKPGEWRVSQVFIPDNIDVPTFQELARQIIHNVLASHPGTTKDRIYDHLVSSMVRKGQMEAHDFDAILRSVAEEVQQGGQQGRWYLKEGADLLDKAEQAKEDAIGKRLEKFMVEYLRKHPEEEGVHFTYLQEEFFGVPHANWPRRRLNDWLPEYFVKTPTGTWRPPDEDERTQLATLREAGTLRRIKRFANALIDGVPVRDKDRPGNDQDLLDWLRQCRRAGLYEQGKAIYEKGGLNLANLTDEQQIEAEDDYRICSRRGSTEEAKPKRQRRKKQDDDE